MDLVEVLECMEWKFSIRCQCCLQTGKLAWNAQELTHESSKSLNTRMSLKQICSVPWCLDSTQSPQQPETKEYINQHICPAVTRIVGQYRAPVRFTSTMSCVYVFFSMWVHTLYHINHNNRTSFTSFPNLPEWDPYNQERLYICSQKKTAGIFSLIIWHHFHPWEFLSFQVQWMDLQIH